MKRLILIFALAVLTGCSKEEIEPEYEYLVRVKEDCMSKTFKEYEVIEEEYERVMLQIEGGSCMKVGFMDLLGNVISGRYAGSSKNQVN